MIKCELEVFYSKQGVDDRANNAVNDRPNNAGNYLKGGLTCQYR